MRKFLAILAILAIPLSVFGEEKRELFTGTETFLSDIALNAAAATRTFTVTNTVTRPQGYELMVLFFNHTANVSSTDIAMTCTASPDDGTTDFNLQSIVVTAGQGVTYDASWKWPSTGTAAAADTWAWRVDIRGYKQVECVVTSTGAAAGDKLTVTGYFVTM